MFNQMFNTMTEQSKLFVEPLFEANKLAMTQAQKLGQKQLELVNAYATLGLKSLEKSATLGSLEDVKSFVEKQVEESQVVSNKIASDTQEVLELGLSFGQEWKTFAEGKVAKATEVAVKAKK